MQAFLPTTTPPPVEKQLQGLFYLFTLTHNRPRPIFASSQSKFLSNKKSTRTHVPGALHFREPIFIFSGLQEPPAQAHRA
jgi:hypothetical protein